MVWLHTMLDIFAKAKSTNEETEVPVVYSNSGKLLICMLYAIGLKIIIQVTFNQITPNPPNLQQIPIGTAIIATKIGATSSDYTEDCHFFISDNTTKYF